MIRFFVFLFFLFFATFNCLRAQQLEEFNYTGSSDSFQKPTTENDHQFNNFTTHWLNDYQKWYRYGNLFKMSVATVEKTLLQSKIDIAGDMGIPGLFLETGFVNGLLNESYISLQAPSEDEFKKALENEKNVLVYVNPGTDLGRQLMEKLPPDVTSWRRTLGAYQYNSPDVIQVDAFYLTHGDRKIFVIASKDTSATEDLKQLIDHTKQVLKDFDLKKGFFGAQTLLKSVTSTEGSPLDVIGEGMNEGASWFVFDGYMGFRMKRDHELDNWLEQVESPIITDLGTDGLYGCKDYEGYQTQMMNYVYKKETYFSYAQKHGCYAFRPVYEPSDDSYSYDGYLAKDGNKEFIDTSHVPFVIQTGNLQDGNLLRSMILFVPKGENFTRKTMWNAIMKRRSVGVLERGKMMGSAKYRYPLDLLVLDKVFLEQYFGDGIDLDAKTTGDSLHLTVKNTFNHDVKGKLTIKLPSTLKMDDNSSNELILPAEAVKEISFKLNPTESAMNKRNPIATYFEWEHYEKGTMTELELPPAISVYRLLYAVAPNIEYPVTIHNFTSRTSYPVEVSVIEKGGNHKTVYHTHQTGSAKPGHYQELEFNLKVPPGQYEVKVSALDQNDTSQLGVGGAKLDGTGAKAYTVDLNGDGIDEYAMENDSVRVTLLTTGARIIQYIVKSQNKNEFIQIWPNKPIDSLRDDRKNEYYPFGGFEDFLGQPSLETFKNYNTKIIKKSGDYVEVQMSAEYYGNTITKTFTLYGNSPLVGIRFKLNFITPSSNVIGPQPMLRFGDGRTQDIIIPTVEGIRHYRPKSIYWGMVFDLQEGWNGGYGEESNLSWVGAYPVSQPLFLHMWFNTPANPGSHYTYTELQPWIPMYQKSNWYFSYYMWGMDGSWEKSLLELRNRNLITQRK